jgi:hypothetical protein
VVLRCFEVMCVHVIRIIVSKRMKSAGHVERMGQNRSAYKVLVGRTRLDNSIGS